MAAVESIKVATKSEFTKDGAEMKEVTFKDDAKILLSKVNGEFFATGAKWYVVLAFLAPSATFRLQPRSPTCSMCKV